MSATILSPRSFAASWLKWRSACLALFLLPARRAHAAAYTPPVAITNWSPLIAVGEFTATGVWDAADFWLDANSVTHTWTGSGQVFTDVGYPAPYVTGANFLAVTPGVFDYTVVVDWSAHPFNYGLPSADCRTTNVLPATFTVVNVTNVTATAYHVAEGHAPITLTARMTPVNAPNKVTWSIVQGEGGGNVSATSGLTTQYDGGTGWRACKVRATCGTNTTDTVIHIYRVTGITASANPVAAGDPVTFTAITDPPNCPLPITWNISTNTDLSVTSAFATPGLINVTATLGSSIAECTLTNVGVKEVQYEWPRDSGIWTRCPFPWYLPKHAEFRVRAKRNPPDIDPENETWPKPVVWSGEAQGSGVIGLAKFPVASSNWVDYRWITATCGTTNPNPAAVFSIDSVQVSTNHAAIGTNQLALTVTTTPALGWGFIGQEIVWSCTNALPNPAQGLTSAFPCDQAGVFTVTATLGSTCGSSSASTNINVYRVTEVTAATNLVAVSNAVNLTATTEPANCPLPLTWILSGITQSVTAPIVAATFHTNGTHTVMARLGTSEASTDVRALHVDILETNVLTFAGKPTSVLFHTQNSSPNIEWSITPTNAGGPSIVSSTDNHVAVHPGTNIGTFTIKATSTELPSVTDTATLTIIGVTVSASTDPRANDAPDMALSFADRQTRSLTPITVTTIPATPNIPFRFEVSQISPNTEDQGSFVQYPAVAYFVGTTIPSYSGGNYDIGYLTKKELKTHRTRTHLYLRPQEISIAVYWGEDLVGTKLVSCNGHFKWLMQENMFQAAVDFANAKYDAGVAGPLFAEGAENFGETASPTGVVTVFKLALTYSENMTAAVLAHEQKHVTQGVVTRLASSLGRLAWPLWQFAPWSAPLPDRVVMGTYANSELQAWTLMASLEDPYRLDSGEMAVINAFVTEFQDMLNSIWWPLTP